MRGRCRRGEVLGYYLGEAGREVDFVAADREGDRHLVQCCADLDSRATREREVRGLTEASRDTGIERATIVSLGEESVERVDGLAIRIVPAWRWLIERA